MKEKIWVVALLCLLVLPACGHVIGFGSCRHEATYAALVAQDQGLRTRICSGWSSSALTRHAQAQALVSGQWEWIHAHDARVYVSGSDEFSVDECFTVEEFMKKRWRVER